MPFTLGAISSIFRHMASALWLGAAALLSPPAPAQAQSTPETTTRSTEFDYHPVHGQVTLERIDPGLPTCVEKAYGYDTRGNKTRVTVRPCAHVTSGQPTWFAPRITLNDFAARGTDEPGATPGTTTHAADAYLTGTRSGAADAAGTGLDTSQPSTQDEAVYDTRFGAAVRQTNVAVGDRSKSLSSRTQYDGFGRVTRQTSALGTYVETAYKICPLASSGGPADPACLTYSTTFTVDSPSKRMVDANGSLTTQATARAISAYYIESTPRAADGTVIGAISRAHYDALHREIAKETQTYDGRWSRTLTAYDQLGMAAASWGPHFADNGSTPPPDELRQWTAARDLLHRPTVQSQYVRTTLTSGAVVVSPTLSYNGLESSATGPAPDGSLRTTRSLKNGAGQTAQSIDAYGATLNMAYDAMGQLRKTVDALGNITTVDYTATTSRFKTGMTDPDLGQWSYTYDALGQLKSQTDAKQQTTDLTYDALGRLVAKTNPTLNANWYYDRVPAGSPEAGSWCAAGLNRLCEATAGNTVVRRQRTSYDDKGRPSSTETVLDRSYTSSVSYDPTTGVLTTATYPSGFALRYSYSTAGSGRLPGVLERVSDAKELNRIFWRIDNLPVSQVFDARGQLLQAQLGNGVQTLNQFDPISGKALALRARSSAEASLPLEQVSVLNQTLEYDQVSNIVKRTNVAIGLTETFRYDLLDRLSIYNVEAAGDASAIRTVTTSYNAVGSILSKSDVGGYAYNASGTAQPHAVRSAGGTHYEYDANGSLSATTGAQTRVNTWTAFNQPERMKYADRTVGFLYDHDYKRVQETLYYRDSNVAVRTTYMIHPDNAGGLGYEREISNGKDESRHYISVGGSVIGVVKTLNVSGMLNPDVSSDPNLTHYWHKDSLGSIVAVSNALGVVTERMAFDAWGRRIKEAGGNDPNLDPKHGDRGFTGHEHLDELALVHMNGRIYDPLIGRFLSGDPVIQSPEDLQNYNRYSYVLNNPLRYTDPNGELWWQVAAFVVGAMLAHNGNSHWRMVGTFMMMASMSSPGGIIESGMGIAAQNSAACLAPNMFSAGMAGNAFLSAAIATAATPGSNGADIMSAGLFAVGFGVAGGLSTGPSVEKFAAHAFLGCLQGAMGGGKCGPSAMASFVGKGMTEALPGGVDWRVRGFMTAVAGGTASVIGGGKFSNGAFQAGFGYIYNFCSQYQSACRAGDAFVKSLLADMRSLVGGQVAYGPGATGMLGLVGVSAELSDTRGADGSRCIQQQVCLLLGVGLGSTVDMNGSVGTGSPGSSWQVAIFGKAAIPFGGGEISPWVGSDGIGIQGGVSAGAFIGGGAKFCVASCAAEDWKGVWEQIKSTNAKK